MLVSDNENHNRSPLASKDVADSLSDTEMTNDVICRDNQKAWQKGISHSDTEDADSHRHPK